jgi:hypothetical protein
MLTEPRPGPVLKAGLNADSVPPCRLRESGPRCFGAGQQRPTGRLSQPTTTIIHSQYYSTSLLSLLRLCRFDLSVTIRVAQSTLSLPHDIFRGEMFPAGSRIWLRKTAECPRPGSALCFGTQGYSNPKYISMRYIQLGGRFTLVLRFQNLSWLGSHYLVHCRLVSHVLTVSQDRLVGAISSRLLTA